MKGGNQSAGRRTLKCTQSTRPKVLLLLPTRWFYPLPLTSTHIRVECRNKQTKLSKVPPAHSGLRDGRHKARPLPERQGNCFRTLLCQEYTFEPTLVIIDWSSSLRVKGKFRFRYNSDNFKLWLSNSIQYDNLKKKISKFDMIQYFSKKLSKFDTIQ